jgi:hypothetical protein
MYGLVMIVAGALPPCEVQNPPAVVRDDTPVLTCCEACGPDCQCGPDCKCSSYEVAFRKATKSKAPLVVFVNQPARDVAGAFVCSVKTFAEVKPGAKAVICSVWNPAIGLERLNDLAGEPSLATIDASCRRPMPQPVSYYAPYQSVWQGSGGGGCSTCRR